MTLNPLAQRFLPAPPYTRFAASSIAQRLARGSIWSLFGSATSCILVLVAMILAARILGQISFDEFGLIQATLGVFGIMAGVGLGGAATRFVAQYAKPDPERAGRVIALVTGSSIITVLVSSGHPAPVFGQPPFSVPFSAQAPREIGLINGERDARETLKAEIEPWVRSNDQAGAITPQARRRWLGDATLIRARGTLATLLNIRRY